MSHTLGTVEYFLCNLDILWVNCFSIRFLKIIRYYNSFYILNKMKFANFTLKHLVNKSKRKL